MGKVASNPSPRMSVNSGTGWSLFILSRERYYHPESYEAIKDARCQYLARAGIVGT